MHRSEEYRAVEGVVRSLGLTCANLSIRQFLCGVVLIHYDDTLINGVTKRLYPKIAEHYPNANWKSVERNLRLARDAIVEQSDPKRLEEVMGFRLRRSLSVGDLLDAVEYYMYRNHLWPTEY